MKSLWMISVLCLVFVTAICSAQELNEDFCASKPNGFYPDPNSCNSYIRCSKKNVMHKTCRRGRIFDPEVKRCKNPLKFRYNKGTGMDCDVAIAGGGLSGLYMAYRLLNETNQTNVCVFEKESRLGGRIYDFFFDEAPDISVGLGAWRIDTNQALMLDLVRELELELYDWTFKEPWILESRGIFYDDEEELKEAYPALRESVFGKMNSNELSAYVWNDTSNVSDYSTLNLFVSHRVTPEGAQFISEVGGYKGHYTDFVSPAGCYE